METATVSSPVVISVRCVGSKKGYPYYAAGLYQRTRYSRGTGHYWRLIKSVTRWTRSESLAASLIPDEYSAVPVVRVRHGYPA